MRLSLSFVWGILAGTRPPDRVPCQESSAARPDGESLVGQRLRVNSFTAYLPIVKPGPAVVNKTLENQRSQERTPTRKSVFTNGLSEATAPDAGVRSNACPEFLHFSGPKAAADTKSCSIIPSGCRIWLEKTLALYQGMAFSHAAHCGEELGL